MSQYSQKFRSQMVRKMVGPPTVSASSLSQDSGVPQTTLSRWLSAASKVAGMSNTKKSSARRPQDWPAAQKMAVVLEASTLSDDDLGAFLRQRGLHMAQLEQWRAQMLQGLETTPRRKKTSPEARRLRALEREVLRKDKALAEASALLILKKKAAAIWGDVDDDTTPRSGK